MSLAAQLRTAGNTAMGRDKTRADETRACRRTRTLAIPRIQRWCAIPREPHALGKPGSDMEAPLRRWTGGCKVSISVLASFYLSCKGFNPCLTPNQKTDKQNQPTNQKQTNKIRFYSLLEKPNHHAKRARPTPEIPGGPKRI